MNKKDREKLFSEIKQNKTEYTNNDKKTAAVLRIVVKSIGLIIILAVAALTVTGIITLSDASLRRDFVQVLISIFH